MADALPAAVFSADRLGEEGALVVGQVRKDLKEVRKRFRRDIDSLENRLKWANIGLMPLLVGLSGIALAVVKRRRMIRK